MTHSTGMGLGLETVVGKEWWISANWGMGVALQLHVASYPDGSDGRWTGVDGAFALSGTYN